LKKLDENEEKQVMTKKEKFIANKYELFKQMEEK
jgi:hypothetical protein